MIRAIAIACSTLARAGLRALLRLEVAWHSGWIRWHEQTLAVRLRACAPYDSYVAWRLREQRARRSACRVILLSLPTLRTLGSGRVVR